MEIKNLNDCKIDEELYSRQLYVLGYDGMREMMRKRMLIVGLDGLGQEIAKNVCLAGIKCVDLHDERTVSISDLETGFYLNHDSVGLRMDEAVIGGLRGVNKYVEMNVVKTFLTENTSEIKNNDRVVDHKIAAINNEKRIEEVVAGYELVVFVNQPFELSVRVNNICRARNVKFIIAETRGLFSRVFCDFVEHIVLDVNGEPGARGIMSYIDEMGVATIVEGTSHGLETGDVVMIDELKYEVVVISNLQLRLIGYTSTECRHGVDFEQVKQPVSVKFRSLSECIKDEQNENIVCLDEFERNFAVHRMFNGVYKSDENSRLKNAFEASAGIQISPMCSVVGGFAAQEAIKAMSGKFMPLRQFFYFNVFDLLDLIEEYNSNNSCCNRDSNNSCCNNDSNNSCCNNDSNNSCCNNDSNNSCCNNDNNGNISSYYGHSMTKLFGEKVFERIRKIRVFLVGAGAIGCENIKNFVMCGIGSAGKIHVTDMDLIEKSNLNRQFLFNAADVGTLKSEAVARKAVRMNKEYENRIKSYAFPVGIETENVFSDAFFHEIDIVVNALDNVESREYMDDRCVLHKVPMFDAGTSGTKGHVQCVIPYLTESYRSAQDPPVKDVPTCTIRLFPFTIDHAISWAVELFKKLFSSDITKIKDYLSELGETCNILVKNNEKGGIDKINGKEINNRIIEKANNNENDGSTKIVEDVKDFNDVEENPAELAREAPVTVELCIKKAISLFVNLFSTQIQDFLNSFPADAVNENGIPFWSPPKRIPTPIAFNINDKIHIIFVETCANLYAECFGVRKITHNEVLLYLENILNLCEPSPITFPDNATSIITPRCVEYDKDSWHADFIYAATNIRARNFSIREQTRHYIKGISGKIVPAIATTTAIVSGLTVFEIIKLAIKSENNQMYKRNVNENISHKRISTDNSSESYNADNYKGKFNNYENISYKNSFLNLSIPFLARVDTIPPLIKKYIVKGKEVSYTLWSVIEIPDLTLGEIIDRLSKIWDKNVSALLIGSRFIYWDAQEKYKKNLTAKLSTFIKRTQGQSVQPLNYITEDSDFEAEFVIVNLDK